LNFPLNKYLTEVEIHDAISRLVYRGETSNMTDGFRLIKNMLTEEVYGILLDIPRTIVVIAAGPPDDLNSMKTKVDLIKTHDIRIITVAFGPKVSESRF